MKKLRKATLLVLIIVMIASLLAACSPKEKEGENKDKAPENTTSGTPAVSTDHWDPSKGAPSSYDTGSEVYTMDNRTPWQGIYEMKESSRADINKAVQALNKKDGNLKVGYATWTVGTPFFDGMYDTVKAECEKYGWTFIPAVSDGDIGQQVANIENFVTLGVDIIIDVAYSGDGEAAAVRTAVDAGIPVIGLGLPFPKGTPLVTNCATMYYEQGFMVGMYAAENFNGKDVKAALSPGMIGHPIAESKINGFIGGFVYGRAIQLGKPFASREAAMIYGYNLEQQIVKSAKFSDSELNWEIVTSIDGLWSRDGGQKAMEDILTAHPDIDLIFLDNDEEAQGAILAMQQAGLKPGTDVQLCCVGDGSKTALELIKEGTLLTMTLASPYTWSKSCMDLAHMIFVDGFDATNLPSDIYLDNVLVTKDNAAAYIPANAEFSTLPDQVFTPLG